MAKLQAMHGLDILIERTNIAEKTNAAKPTISKLLVFSRTQRTGLVIPSGLISVCFGRNLDIVDISHLPLFTFLVAKKAEKTSETHTF